MLHPTRSAAEYLQKQLGLTRDETEVILYGLQVIIYSLAGILTICLMGWLLGCFWTTLAVALAAGSLRLLSGGAHSSSPLICNLLGMVMAPLLAIIAEFAAVQIPHTILLYIVLLGAAFSLLSFYILAPVDSPAKPITKEQERRKFNCLSVALVTLITLGQIALLLWGNSPAVVLAVSLGTWWQAFTLTKAGHRFAYIVDHLFKRGCEI
ncbi:MAG: accessory gene regulator B family protein [Syntrophaceticus sp.]